MSRFLNDANQILEAASASDDSSGATNILIGPNGRIRIVESADVSLEALQAEHGCGTAYRVTRNRGVVRVEGRRGNARCVIENRVRSSKGKEIRFASLSPYLPVYALSEQRALTA